MSLIRNDQIQSTLVTYLKSNSTITSALDDADEIREDGWKGTEFTYPNIRIRMISNEPMYDVDCYQRISVSFMVFSEEASSLESDQIAGIIGNELHNHPFSANSFTITLKLDNLVPAIWQGEHIWRSEAIMSGIMSG